MRIDDTRPIWIQLADSFRSRITNGMWKPGEKIPSVRDLAIEAGTNPNTVQRALAALDEEGLTIPKRTAGRFVATDDAALRTLLRDDARAAASAYIRACRALGVEKEDAHRLLDERWDTDSEHTGGIPS